MPPRINSAKQRLSSTSISGKTGEELFLPAVSLRNFDGGYQFGVLTQVIRGSVRISVSLVPIDMAEHDTTCFVAPQTLTPGSIELLGTLGVTYRLEFLADSEIYLWGV